VLATDHPLVQSTFLDSNELVIYLKTLPGAADERFRFSRDQRIWRWEVSRNSGGYGDADNWESIPIDPPVPVSVSQSAKKPTGGYGSGGGDLDDDIPF
jgi:hypothetical protein